MFKKILGAGFMSFVLVAGFTTPALATVVPPAVGTEEFAATDGSYKGISVGFNTTDITDASAVSVTMTRADGSTVTKTANSGVLTIINAGGLQHLTAPFVIQEGTFTEASDLLYWNPAPATWTTGTRPTSVTIDVTTASGVLSATNSSFSDGAPSWPTYESLLPPTPPTENTVTVMPTSLQGWAASSAAAGQTTFVATTSVLGDGALKLVTTGDVNSVTRISRPFDLNLSDIAKVSYATRQVAAADAINGNVTLRISIDANNDGTMDDQLMYEPYYNGFSGGTDWKTWNVTKTGGKFWSNFENTYNGKGGVAAGSYDSNFTLADVLAGNPNAKITAFVISMGTYNVSQTVLADDLEVTVGSDTTIFDFEPAAPIIPTASTVTVTGNTSAGENQEGWLFNRDLTTETPYEFITGTSSIGAGSLYVQPIANNYNGANGTCKAGADQTGCNKFIGELFLLTPISDIDSISYDFNIASGTVAAKGHFYMSVYANFGVSPETKFYDCRYSVVPATGSTNGFTTVTFDPALSYPVATRGGSEASPFACPASPDAMGAGATIRAVSLNVGDTSASDMGIAGYLDNVLVRTSTDSAINTTTYDFEKAAVTPPPAEETGGSSHHRRGGTRIATPVQIPTDGEVLGAQTGPECATPLFTSYMRMGDTANDPIQVKLLQSFLNVEMGSVLPITGFFGPMTDAAVKALQTKYASEVLAPWGLTQPSGWVYKFTQRKINLITCSALNIPVPSAVIDARDL